MPISDLCRENLVTVEPNATLLDAARLMKDKHVGDLVVVGRADGSVKPVGIVTDRDVVLAAADDRPLSGKRVEEIMTRSVQVLHGNEGVYNATALMREKSIRRVPVVNDDGQVIGIITADDLHQLLSKELADLAAICDRQISREGAPRQVVNSDVYRSPGTRTNSQTHA